jgi:hypothetical protein
MPKTTAAPPAGLEHKSAAGVGPVDVVDENEGVVEAIVSVTGVVDRVKDRILPGAYRGRPIGVWSHDDKQWASRTEAIDELQPGDPRLPATTADGRPWPSEAGGLWVKTRYNLDTRTGREAFSNVKFFAEQTGWSIGYRVPPGGSYMKDGVRNIKELEVWEYSPVMVGAAPEAMTLSVKSAMQPDEVDVDLDETTDGEPDVAALHAAANDEIDWAEVAAADPGENNPPGTTATGDGDGWESLFDELGGAPEQPDGVPADEVPPTDLAATAEVKGKDYAEADRKKLAKSGEAMPDGSYPIKNWDDLKAAISAYGRAKDKEKCKAHIIKRARALKATNLLPKDWDASTKKSAGGELEEKAGGADRNRGNAENLRHWYVHGGGAAEIGWGTPDDFYRCVAIAGKHMTPENARGYCNLRHQEAVGAPPGKGHPDSKSLLGEYDPAAEVGDHAGWQIPPAAEQITAEVKAFPFIPGTFEATQSAIRKAAWEQFRGEPVDDASYDTPDGPEQQQAPSAAGGDGDADTDGDSGYEWDSVDVVGTWPDRVVITRMQWSHGGDVNRETFEVPFTADGEMVTFGAPSPVELQVSAVPVGGAPAADDGSAAVDAAAAPTDAPAVDAAAAPTAGMVDQAATAMKTALLTVPEVKAGRVLSASNADRLRSAVERLLEVLSEAGVDVTTPAPGAGGGMPGEMGDMGGKTATVLLDPAEYARGLRLRAGL